MTSASTPPAGSTASTASTTAAARHVVLDLDFGVGARFADLCVQWRASPFSGPLHYLAVLPRLPAAEDIAAPELRAAWPLALPGWQRIELDEGCITLDLMAGEVEQVLTEIDARVDAFYLPAGRAEHSVPARALARLAVQGATLQAKAPDEAQVWALTAAGFACQAAPDTQDIRAVYASRRPHAEASRAAAPAASTAASTPPSPSTPAPAPARQAIVIGAGLAGSAICERLCARGWDVTLIERHPLPAQEASGNLAGIFMPLLSKDDNIPTRLSRAAYLHALRAWRRLGGVGQAFDGDACGVLQLSRDAAHARVQQDVVAAWDYPPAYVRWLDATAARALMGASDYTTPHGGWLFEQAGWAHPGSLCAAMLDACGARLRRIFSSEALSLRRMDAGDTAGTEAGREAGSDTGAGQEPIWQVLAAGGAVLAQAPTVILANGAGATRIAQAADLPLAALRGQVTHLNAADDGVPQLPLVVCREAYVTPPSRGIVSAGATYDKDDDPALRLSSQQENLARLAEILPQSGAPAGGLQHAPLAGRVGFRCAAPDRLPLVGALPDYPSAGRLERLRDVPRHPGLYGLLGYASRGLIWAPLMAELLACQLQGAPAPLEASLVAALDPGRFLLKQRRRSQ